jgi:hypothetical protein
MTSRPPECGGSSRSPCAPNGVRTQPEWRAGRTGDASAASVSLLRYASARGHRDRQIVRALDGKGIRKKTFHGAKAGTRTITVPLTATGQAARRHHTRMKLTITLTAAGRTGIATTSPRA